jgi:Zn ribbon nucleic-acid-binding protein
MKVNFIPNTSVIWGRTMAGLLAFYERYRDEQSCILGLAELRWPNGFKCAQCEGQKAYQLKARPRVFECAQCGHQKSVTAGTIFHRTRTPLHKWFLAAWWIMSNNRGVSATFLSRALSLRYGTAWTMMQKLRQAMAEQDSVHLAGLVEFGESNYGGHGKSKQDSCKVDSQGGRVLMMAVEKRPAGPFQGKAIRGCGFMAGSARLGVRSSANAEQFNRFVHAVVEPGSRLVSMDFEIYGGGDAGYRRFLQEGGVRGQSLTPIIHVLLRNLTNWLNGTFHGVSAKHLPLYVSEWNYRFNRRRDGEHSVDLILHRAAFQPPITYRQLVDGQNPKNELPVLTG